MAALQKQRDSIASLVAKADSEDKDYEEAFASRLGKAEGQLDTLLRTLEAASKTALAVREQERNAEEEFKHESEELDREEQALNRTKERAKHDLAKAAALKRATIQEAAKNRTHSPGVNPTQAEESEEVAEMIAETPAPAPAPPLPCEKKSEEVEAAAAPLDGILPESP